MCYAKLSTNELYFICKYMAVFTIKIRCQYNTATAQKFYLSMPAYVP